MSHACNILKQASDYKHTAIMCHLDQCWNIANPTPLEQTPAKSLLKFIYWTKKKKHTLFNGITFFITQHVGAGKLHPSQEALFISSTFIVYSLDQIRTAKHGISNIFTCRVSLTTHLNVCNHICKLAIAETLHSNKEWLGRASPSSTEKGQQVCCKRAWGLQTAPDVSMGYTQQLCCWDIAYKRLGPPGTIHIVGYLQEPQRQRIGIFPSNTYGVTGDHPQELLQKHQGVIMPEYPHRPCLIISGDLHCVPDDRIEAPSWIDSGVLQGSTGYSAKPFVSQSASHRTSLDQIQQSLHSVLTVPYAIEHRQRTVLISR